MSDRLMFVIMCSYLCRKPFGSNKENQLDCLLFVYLEDILVKACIVVALDPAGVGRALLQTIPAHIKTVAKKNKWE